MVDCVSELTRERWSDCWSMSIKDFFIYYSYLLYKNAQKKKQLNELARKKIY